MLLYFWVTGMTEACSSRVNHLGGGICEGQVAPHVGLQIMDEKLVRDGGRRNIEFFGQNM